MPETEYVAVASSSESGSREPSLDAKREYSEYDELHNDDVLVKAARWLQLTLRRLRLSATSAVSSIPPLRLRPQRTSIFTAFILMLCVMLFYNLTMGHRVEPPEPQRALAPPDPEYNRIAKVSMLYGDPSEAYERALKSHERHAERWGYRFYALRKDEGCGFWTKLVYLMSILGQELQKDPKERAEWLMWVDADSIILNPNIPLSIFLPPPSIPHVHFVGTRDWNGLNNGVFFVRVHPWSVSMFTSALSYPLCHNSVDLGGNVEQEAMRLTFARPSGGARDLGWKSGVAYMPKVWFNTYEMAMNGEGFREEHPELVVDYPGLKLRHYYEGQRGNMLVHCPGTGKEVRGPLMMDWMDLIEDEWELQYGSLNASKQLSEEEFANRTAGWEGYVEAAHNSHIWTLPLAQTNYTSLTEAFWDRYSTAMELVREATTAATNINVVEAALSLRVSLAEEADNEETIEKKITSLRSMLEEEN